MPMSVRISDFLRIPEGKNVQTVACSLHLNSACVGLYLLQPRRKKMDAGSKASRKESLEQAGRNSWRLSGFSYLRPSLGLPLSKSF